MGQYSRGFLESGINDIGNGVTLRSDVHGCFDRSNFVFYPLHDDTDIPNISDSLSPRYVAAAINDAELCYAYLLHRKEVHMHPRVSDEFLFARFAFAIISLNSSHTYFNDLAVPVPLKLAESSQSPQQSPRKSPKHGTDQQRPSTVHEHNDDSTCLLFQSIFTIS